MKERLQNCIYQKRKLAGLTQIELAQAVGVTRQTIIAIEKGNYVPSVLLALRLAGTLSCDVASLFFEN